MLNVDRILCLNSVDVINNITTALLRENKHKYSRMKCLDRKLDSPVGAVFYYLILNFLFLFDSNYKKLNMFIYRTSIGHLGNNLKSLN